MPPHIPEHVICKALAKMKVGKAAGSSGVVAEMLKASGAAGISYITHLFNLIIRERKIPSDWHKSVILNLFKGKGDRARCAGPLLGSLGALAELQQGGS